jgi:hypothetical protein
MRLTSAFREVVGSVALAGLLGAFCAGGALASPAAVGQVVAVSGAVQAAAPGEEPRTLACNDWLYEGETLMTSGGARVGILSQDVYAQLDTSTRLLTVIREGVPEFRVVSGAVRIVDTRIASEGRRYVIGTTRGYASGLGGDIEVWAVPSPGEGHWRVCNREAPLRISVAASALGEEGDCALLTADGFSPAESAPAPTIGLAGEAVCPTEFGDVAARFTPTDVAAPPFGLLDFPDVMPGPASPRDPCDDPAGGCGFDFARPEPPFGQIPPDTGGCPPGAICGD